MTRLIDADALKKAIELEEGIFWDSYSSDELVISKKYIEDAPTVDTDLSKYSDKLWKEAYERGHKRGHKEGYEQAILDGKTNFSRPHGKWDVISLLRDYVYIRCSECGQSTRLVRDSKNEFCCIKDIRDKVVACPYCGADMRGKKNV